MSNYAPIETGRYVQPASEHTPTITMARLDEWFEGEIQDLKAQAVASKSEKDVETFKARAMQAIIMQEHMRSETFRLLDEANK
jgi:hypothetical protein